MSKDASYVMNQSLQTQVKLFHLNKTQTESNLKIQEGKIIALKDIIFLYETLEEDKNEDFLFLTKRNLEVANEELVKLQALAMLHKNLAENLEQSLIDLDIQQFTKDILFSVETEIAERHKAGKCCFKRPGKIKFPCDNKATNDNKYCSEHAKDFE